MQPLDPLYKDQGPLVLCELRSCSVEQPPRYLPATPARSSFLCFAHLFSPNNASQTGCLPAGVTEWVTAADTRPPSLGARQPAQPHRHVGVPSGAHHPGPGLDPQRRPAGAPSASRRKSTRRSRRRRQGPPPLPYDTATIEAALARASAGSRPPARRRAWRDGRRRGPIGLGSGLDARLTELHRRRGGPSAGFRRGPAGAEKEERARTAPRRPSVSTARMTTSGALFPSLVPGSRGSSTKYLVEFRAGKMSLKGTTVTPDKRKGLVYIQQTDDSLIHFCWKDRTSGTVEDDLIIFPDDCEFKRVPQCPSGRVYVLKFKAGSKRLFFWMQEPKTDQDEEHCRKVNECLNNPPMPGALGASGSGGHELSALGGEGGLQSLLGNMSHSQLMQLIGPAGLGGLGGLGALTGPGLASLLGSSGPPASSSSSSSRSQSAAVTPSSTTSSARATPAPSAPAAASTTSPSPAPSSGNGTSTAASPTQPIQLSDLQSILATMNVPAGPGGSQQVDLASVLTPEIMAPILANADVQERLLPYLPSGESLPQTADEIQNTLTSPQFQQALGMFSAALASGQLGPLMCQFGLPAEAVEAANKGDVEAFAKAMQNNAKSEPKEGDAKDKKDEEEDMSLD